MASKYILLLLPTLIYAKIEIDIFASQNEQNRDIRISGVNVDVISDIEKNTFGLNDEALKQGVLNYFGKSPDSTYVHSPTPWGDLYSSYGWPEVSRTLSPQRAKILSVKSLPTVVLTQILHNNSSKTADINAQISQSVQNTVSSTWNKGGDFTVGQAIEYGIDIEVASASGKTSFSYTTQWGESTMKSESVTVGSESGVNISLAPNQSVTAELYATKGTMMIQVDYVASLSGAVAVNYGKTYKGHHFWSLDVNAVMNAGGLKKSIQSSEVITLGYYSDARVVITDAESNSLVYNIPVPVNMY